MTDRAHPPTDAPGEKPQPIEPGAPATVPADPEMQPIEPGAPETVPTIPEATDNLRWLDGDDPWQPPQRHLVRDTGQLWKFVVAVFVALGCTIALDTGLPDRLGGLWYVALIAIGVGSFAFACLSIRCPRCRTPWMWAAVSQRDSREWTGWLFALHRCPRCRYPDPVDDPSAPHVVCPRCKETSSNTSFCEVCGKDLRQDRPAVTGPDDRTG